MTQHLSTRSILLGLLALCQTACTSTSNERSSTPIVNNIAQAPPPTTTDPGAGSTPGMVPENLPPPQIDGALLLRPEQLVTQVQEAVNPIYPNWVLFKHGTYVVFDNKDHMPDLVQKALDLMKEHRPKTAEAYHWDYSVTELHRIEGWSVHGNGYGIYTYVYPREMADLEADMPQVAAFAKAKRALDEAVPEVVYVHDANGLRPYTKQ